MVLWMLDKAPVCSTSILDFDNNVDMFIDHVTVSFARSGGPGGQNVNKGINFGTLRC